VITKHDTTIIKVTETVHSNPVPVGVIAPDTQYLAMWIDTMDIVKDYLSRYAYSDTVRNKYGYVLIIDTIHENKIAARQVDFHLDIPQITLTSVTPQKNKVFAGLGLGGSKDFVSFGGGLFLLTKSDKLYYVGASYTSLGGIYYSAGAAFKIKL